MPAYALTSTLTEQEAAELKARHLACGHLVGGCRDAIFQLRKRAAAADDESLRLARRTIDILEGILESWCETLSIVRSASDPSSSHTLPAGFDLRDYSEAFGFDSQWGQTPFVDHKSVAHLDRRTE